MCRLEESKGIVYLITTDILRGEITLVLGAIDEVRFVRLIDRVEIISPKPQTLSLETKIFGDNRLGKVAVFLDRVYCWVGLSRQFLQFLKFVPNHLVTDEIIKAAIRYDGEKS